MARPVSLVNQALLESSALIARDFLWVIARDRVTGDDVPVGFWSGIDDITISMLHPDTGIPETRTYIGSGTLIQTSEVPLVSSLTVQTITITTSQLHEAVSEAIRVYDAKQARVELHRGLYNPLTNALDDYPLPRFLGFLDDAPINDPAEGNDGSASLSCTSNTQEITRSNPDTRSHASQQLRLAHDEMMLNTATIGEVEFWWGQNKGKVSTTQGGINSGGDPDGNIRGTGNPLTSWG